MSFSPGKGMKPKANYNKEKYDANYVNIDFTKKIKTNTCVCQSCTCKTVGVV